MRMKLLLRAPRAGIVNCAIATAAAAGGGGDVEAGILWGRTFHVKSSALRDGLYP